ncbi:MAG: ATP-binding cassette domain-containing protein [Defluviitaleaceae bacterium]|nr:ATP-binding cassette domain-containing protein [Defluviitaleaceae bacterium]
MKLLNLSKKFNTSSGTQVIFDETNFVFDHELMSIAIRGRSGSGKSTLLAILSGFEFNYEGNYEIEHIDFSTNKKKLTEYRLQHFGIISQEPLFLEDRNIFENLAFPLRLMKIDKKEIKRRIIEELKELNLEHLMKKYPNTLSGGEKQRIAIVRALIKRPKYVIADEPTSELDEATELQILDYFKNKQEGGVRFIIATHSDTIANRCDEILLISHHKLSIIMKGER